MRWISPLNVPAICFSHAPVTVAAVAPRCSASRSSPVSCRNERSAAAISDSLAACASAKPCRARRQDSAKAVGQESRRLPRISTAKEPARRRGRVPLAISERTAVRKASNACESSASAGVRLQFQSHWRAAGTETRLIDLCCVDVAFQAADEHFSYPTTRQLGEFVGAGEAHGIQQFEQAGEGSRVTVVRCCRQEQLMLETWCHRSQHSAQFAVFAVRRRHQIVAFIDDQ